MPLYSISKIIEDRRRYNTWVATETLEDYSLRYAPKSFRKWSEWLVANTAIGGLSFLALEAIGGSISITYGFANALWAIVVVGLIIFLTGLPITYYAAKYNVDMDLLTRGAGFGYIGSTITSLIYASFTFIFFALESAIMAQALELYFHLPLAIGYVICSIVIIPIVFFGITLINQLQLWTQPLWIVLMILPYLCILYKEPQTFSEWLQFAGKSPSGAGFNPLLFGSAATVSFSLIAQIGEQVDYLRFLPDQQTHNSRRWWVASILAGPGWILFGCAKQLGGAFLASLAIAHGVSFLKANEPTQMYLVGFEYVFSDPQTVLAVTTLFVIISQIKINVTNAYAGSLAWSNFFSRLTHSHPGRVVWLVFNVAIALLLMELDVFSTLEAVLGLYANIAIAWIGALVADLVINKPLGLSPSYIEFKRAHLYNINPVGVGSMSIASIVAILAFVGVFGIVAKAFASFIALGLAFVLAPIIAVLTKGKYYIARKDTLALSDEQLQGEIQCNICEQDYEPPDMLFCPVYGGSICSLCCSLDACCHDACKVIPTTEICVSDSQTTAVRSLRTLLQEKFSPQLGARLLKYLAVFLLLAGLTGATLGFVYYQQVITISGLSNTTAKQLTATLLGAYGIFLVLIGIGSWWLVLTHESRRLAQEELDQRNAQLQQEVQERQLAEQQLQEKAQQLEQTLLNLQQAKSQLMQTEKMAALGRLVAGVAHEINTPIGIGVTAASLLVEKTENFSQRFQTGAMKRSDLDRFLDVMQQGSQMTLTNLNRAAELIQSFKQVAVDQSSESKRVFNLSQYLEEILLQISPKLKGLHSVTIQGDRAHTLNSYPGAFSQIITNLVINSIVHAYLPHQRGRITIAFARIESHLILEYRDDGQGILAEHLGKIFEPFFTTKRGQGGSGLGLHIVYNLVTQKLGGTIYCESQPEQGARFIMRLPASSL
ncbi:MAG TPA: ATP-binding protein [Leptolyngbya sp.]|nr:ATP-binding protein [Leptolyngbya sp.]